MEDIQIAYNSLRAKQGPIQRLFAYYDGTAAAPLIADRLRDVYQDKLALLNENWCEVVIDSLADRIELEKIEGPTPEVSESLALVMSSAGLLLEADEAHKHALVAGESFLFAGRAPIDDDGDLPVADLPPLEFYAIHPCQAHAQYDAERPNILKWAAKWYESDDGYTYIVLYYRDRFDTFRLSTKSVQNGNTKPKFEVVDSVPNEDGVIPVFHFRTAGRRARSDLQNIVPLQDALNILITNMLVTSEYAAAPLKFVISSGTIPKRLRVEPNRIWDLPAGDANEQATQVGQLEAADISNFLTPIDHFINSLVAISRTPRHYFTGGEAPSGEALQVMESPLVKKARDRIARFTPVWRQVGAYIAQLLDHPTVSATDILITFCNPITAQPLSSAMADTAQAQSYILKTQLGLPKRKALEELDGYTEEEARALIAESAAEQTNLGDQLLTGFARGAP